MGHFHPTSPPCWLSNFVLRRSRGQLACDSSIYRVRNKASYLSVWSKCDQQQHTLLPGAFQAHPNLLNQCLPFLGMPLWWFMCTVKIWTPWAPAGISVSAQPHSGVPKYQNFISWELRRNLHPRVPSLRFCFWDGTKTKPPQVVIICCRVESCLWAPSCLGWIWEPCL